MSDNNQESKQAQATENVTEAAKPAEGAKVHEEVAASEKQGEQGKENEGKKPEETRPKRNRYQERLGEITAKRRLAETDAGSVRELIREITGNEPPKASDFKSEDEYRTAMAEFRQKLAPYQALKDKSERTLQNIDREYMQTLADGWDDRVAEVSKDLKDWRDVVSASRVPMSQELMMTIMESDLGPEIAYHLAKHPDEASELTLQLANALE